MGAWGPDTFENDDANDWASELVDRSDLSLVSETLMRVLDEPGYVEVTDASQALAACEIVARCLGRPGAADAYTATVDEWVARIQPCTDHGLREMALRAIDRVRSKDSELAELWEEADPAAWERCVKDLRRRLTRD